MDNASKEIKEYGMIKMFLPEAGTFESAVPYRENKIKPLFIKMKNQIAALAGKLSLIHISIMRWMKTENSTEQRKSGRNSLIPRTKHLIPAHITTSHSTCLLYTSSCV